MVKMGLEQLYAVPRKTDEQGSYRVFVHNQKLGSPWFWQVVVVDATW